MKSFLSAGHLYFLTAVLAVLFASGGMRASRRASKNVAAGIEAVTLGEQRAAAELFQLANQDRSGRGLQPLRQDQDLTRAARTHARIMVHSGALSHQLPGEPDLIVRAKQAGVRFSTVAENVAEAPSAAQINNEWMHSPPHRANLLDPRVNAVGIAVVQRGGELYAVQDFAREVSILTRQQQEQEVGALLSSRGLRLDSNDRLAISYCGNTAARQRPAPRLVMKYITSNLDRLPQQVEKGIAAGRFHLARVGACHEADQNGFTSYQIVILLY